MFKNLDFIINNRGLENENFECLSKEIFREYLKNNYGFNGLLKTYKHQGGLECDPVNGIGFQAKFFGNKIDWNQIKTSSNIIIKNLNSSSFRNYSNLNTIIFFFNFELTKSKIEEQITNEFKKHGISVIFFTDYQKFFLSSPKIYDIFLGKNFNNTDRFRYRIDLNNNEYEIKEYLNEEGKEKFRNLIKEIFRYMTNGNEYDLRDLIIHDDGFSIDKNNKIFNNLFINQQKPFEFNEGVFDISVLDSDEYVKLFHSCFLMSFRKKTNRSNNLNITKSYKLKRVIPINDFKDENMALTGIGYDNINGVLALRFYSNNSIYHYIDFPIEIYNKILQTNKYNFNLVKNYKYAWIGPDWCNATIQIGDSFAHLCI